MQTSPAPITDAPAQSATTTTPTVRWDGHMCDDVGATYGHAPLAFMSASKDELWLCGNRGNYRFPRATIRKLGRGRLYPWLFGAVSIHHDVQGYPAELQFKSLDTPAKEILRQLESLGYPR